MMNAARISRFGILAAMLAVAALFAGQWPRDQTVHYVLGDSAPEVQELTVRWARQRPPHSAVDPRADEDWMREVTFRFAPGRAPRIVTHEPRLLDGEYTVEIEIVASDSERRRVRRQVDLGGGVTQIALGSSSMAERASPPVGR